MPNLTRRGLLAAAALAAAAGCATSRRSVGSSPPSPPVLPPSATIPTATPAPGATTPAGPVPTETAPTAPEATRLPGFLANGPRTRPEVALTFHAAGDPSLADQLLALVEGAGVPVTVFAVGTWLAANPDQAARISRGGHELANHTHTHPTLGALGPAAVLAEITRCRDVIAQQTGSPGRWFRPSAMDTPTPVVTAQAVAAGYPTIIGYDVDSRDFTDPGAATVTRLTLDGVRNGSIVSMHFDHRNTIDALPAILAGLRTKGLTPVTVSRLLRP